MKLTNTLAISLVCLALGACSKEDASTTMDRTSDAAPQTREAPREADVGAMEMETGGGSASEEIIKNTAEQMESTGEMMNQTGEALQPQE